MWEYSGSLEYSYKRAEDERGGQSFQMTEDESKYLKCLTVRHRLGGLRRLEMEEQVLPTLLENAVVQITDQSEVKFSI